MSSPRAGKAAVPNRQAENYDSGFTWHLLAEKYRSSGDIVFDHAFPDERIDFAAWVGVFEPLAMLYGHSIELNFKAFLLSKRLAFPMHHDLDALGRLCSANGLDLPREAQNAITGLNLVFAKSAGSRKRDYRARYPAEPGGSGTEAVFPDWIRWSARLAAQETKGRFSEKGSG